MLKWVFQYVFLAQILLIVGCKKDSSKPMLKKTNNTSQTILGMGDSYTYGESVKPNQRYLSLLVDTLQDKGYNLALPTIIAKTGWTTQELLESETFQSDSLQYDFVFLLIGVNNEYRGQTVEQYESEFEKCLNAAIGKSKQGNKTVFVISIPDYSVTKFMGRQTVPNAISTRIDQYNVINQSKSAQKKVNYIEITQDSRNALSDESLIASDGLHPSEKMYKSWAIKILPMIEPLLKTQ